MPASPRSTAATKSQKSHARSGSSRQNRTTSRYRSTDTTASACPKRSTNSTTSSPKYARSRASTSGGDSGSVRAASELLPDVLAGDLLLQLDDAVQERLRPGRAP